MAENKKNVRIAGGAAVVTSTQKLADLKTIQKYNPDALKLMGGKNDDEVLFMIGIADKGYGGFCGNMGIMFAPNTTDADGHATITVMIPEGTVDSKKWFVDNFGGAIMKLNELETKLPAVLEKLAADKKAVEDAIEIG